MLSPHLCSAAALGVLLGACGSSNDSAGSPQTPGSDGASGLPAGAAEQFVRAHNEVRAAVTEPAGYSGTWQPLPPVTWSSSAQASAQAWANHLRDTNSCGLSHENQSSYGENLAAGTNLTPTGAVEMWASEQSNYAYGDSYQSATGHYTQLVWRDSVEIGCGMARCGERIVVISCRYSPPGNFMGEMPY